MTAKRKLIRRNAHKMIAKIFEDSTTAKVYTLNNGFVGESVGVEWVKKHTANISHAEYYDNLNGTYTIRIHSNLWYELASENKGPDVIRIKISYALEGYARSGECWVSTLDAMKQIATDLELVADGPIIVTIGAGGAKCKDCGSSDWDVLTPINTVPEYVCSSCYEKHDEKMMENA